MPCRRFAGETRSSLLEAVSEPGFVAEAASFGSVFP